MRVFLYILATIGFIVLIAGGLFVFAVVRIAGEATALLEGASDYADETVAAFGEAWDVDTLMRRGSPEFLEAVRANPQGLQTLEMALKQNFSPLLSAEPAVCDGFNIVTTANGRVATANCTVLGNTRRARLQFQVSSVHRNEKWALLGMFVDTVAVEAAPEAPVMINVEPSGVLKVRGWDGQPDLAVASIAFSARDFSFTLATDDVRTGRPGVSMAGLAHFQHEAD